MKEYYIGLMSGTSLDAIDAVLMDFSASSGQAFIHHDSIPYPNEIRQQVLSLQDVGSDELNRACLLARQLTVLYAQAVDKLLCHAEIAAAQIVAIGCHGQTIRHAPEHGFSIQLANLPLLAELTGIDVIGDFRNQDIAAGGQGAPLVPAFHHYCFGNMDNRVVLNIGGIANITVLSAKGDIRGFDTGPGNMLMDAWMQLNWGKSYDDNGHFASQGRVDLRLLEKMLADPYFAAAPPKSTGRDYFNLLWLKRLLNDENPHDVQATLLELTARSIYDAIFEYAPQTQTVIVCGGGVNNQVLLNRLQSLHPQTQYQSVDQYGLGSQCVEGAAFAWLARQFVLRKPGNVPAVTGAAGYRVLGALYPAYK